MENSIQLHGSIPYEDVRRMGISPSAIHDFSATVNPFPLPEEVRGLINHEGIKAYPDPESFAAVEALAGLHNVSPAMILICTGTTELIFTLPVLFNRPVQLAPTYGDYRRAFLRKHHDPRIVPFPENDGQFNLLIDELRDASFDLLLICNPNNPDGRYLSPGQIGELCMRFPDATICVDESYQEMGKECVSLVESVKNTTNLLVLKSLTKPFGIGGLRIGYGVAGEHLVSSLRELLLPWGVSSIAQRIVPAIVDRMERFREQWTCIHREKRRMMDRLSANGISVSCRQAPFFLALFKNVALLRRQLLRLHHIAVRDCTSFGLMDTIRIMPSLQRENDLLLKALEPFI